MAETRTYAPGTPSWVDLSSTDVEGSKRFYTELFGWEAAVAEDPAAGGYTMLRLDGGDVAGLGPTMGEGQPAAWSVYIDSEDAEATARKVEAAGGRVVAPPFDVLGAGRMGVFQDPAGAFISVWQPKAMAGAAAMQQPNTVGWVELNSRDVEQVRTFYRDVFGWGEKRSPMGEGMGEYTEWQLGGESVAGAMPMAPGVPEQVPNFWLVYFLVGDIDATVARARELGAQVQMGPAEYPGGRFAVLTDPQGAVFGLIAS